MDFFQETKSFIQLTEKVQAGIINKFGISMTPLQMLLLSGLVSTGKTTRRELIRMLDFNVFANLTFPLRKLEKFGLVLIHQRAIPSDLKVDLIEPTDLGREVYEFILSETN